jgi:hypothetical protein
MSEEDQARMKAEEQAVKDKRQQMILDRAAWED